MAFENLNNSPIWMKNTPQSISHPPPKYKGKAKECCFSSPGGPWPRGYQVAMAMTGSLTDHIITIVVGTRELQQTFQWFKLMLDFHCPVITACLKSGFKEAETGMIELPHDDPDVFAQFLSWISDHRFTDSTCPIDEAHDPLARQLNYDLLVRIYIFADKYIISRLQNVVINATITAFATHKGPLLSCTAFFAPRTIDLIYTRLPTESPLRTLTVNMVVYSWPFLPRLFRDAVTHAETHGGPEGYCAAFITDVFCKYIFVVCGGAQDLKHRSWWLTIPRCYYHVKEAEMKGCAGHLELVACASAAAHARNTGPRLHASGRL